MDQNGGYLMKFLNITSLILGALVVGSSVVAVPPSKTLPIFQANKAQQAPRSWLDYAFSRPNVQTAAQEIINTQQETVPQETVSQETVSQGTAPQETAEATNSTETQEEPKLSLRDVAKTFVLEAVIPAVLRQNSYIRVAYYPYFCWRHGLRKGTELFIIDSIKSMASAVTGRQNLMGGSMTGLSGFLTRLTTTIILDTAIRSYIATPWINTLLGTAQSEQQSAQPNSEEQSTQPTNV
jgi:sarcosine oxidase delta subunit